MHAISSSIAGRPIPAVAGANLPRPCASASYRTLYGTGRPKSTRVAAVEPAMLAMTASQVADIAEGLDTPAQLLYVTFLVGLLSTAGYFAVRQVLIRRELDELAKVLGEKARTGDATCEDYFELGAVLMRKRLFTQAVKNIQKAIKNWDGEEAELAQVHNALGYAYYSMERYKDAVKEYQRAVALQPGYYIAWNNMGDAYEALKDWSAALDSYKETLALDPENRVAKARAEAMSTRLSRVGA